MSGGEGPTQIYEGTQTNITYARLRPYSTYQFELRALRKSAYSSSDSMDVVDRRELTVTTLPDGKCPIEPLRRSLSSHTFIVTLFCLFCLLKCPSL